MSTTLAFPYPIPEYGAEPYWAACNEERFVMQRCKACQKFRWHPAPLCTHCSDERYVWAPLSGRGTVVTWTVITHPIHPAAVAKVPYVVAQIELDEQHGLTLISNLINIPHDEIQFDMPVKVCFETHPSGQKLPVFGRA